MSNKIYVAAVMVTCHVAGERVIVQPGEPLPELPEHDVQQLLAMKAIRDPEADAAAAKADARVEKSAQADFKAAKAALAAEAKSVQDAGTAAESAAG